ncbi:hypothetical protein BDA96_10G294000 [Sorghum bicolor]|uniref:Uncharacterized protein n=2 Tax=Sorghum bicolor TaxID=4558 RepID=A0A921U2G1_SORBI|nr:hypothetical protein BDA96_10G294000 [Sorghum bicolor]OQU76876.1 hypothetical protein SORBI_3010G226600 [Sorghum bicolor]
MAYAPHANELELVAAHAVPVDHVQRRLLYAGRILVTGGWLVVTYTISSNSAANAEHALVGLFCFCYSAFRERQRPAQSHCRRRPLLLPCAAELAPVTTLYARSHVVLLRRCSKKIVLY